MSVDQIEEHWRRGTLAWPSVSVERGELAAYIGHVAPEAAQEPSEVRALHWEDLYLACACARGDSTALAVFERELFGEVDIAAAQGARGLLDADELKQMVRKKLFVAAKGERPKITEYSGRGALRGWLRIVALRMALNVAQRARREIVVEPEDLAHILGAAGDPELDYLRKAYTEELRAAFAEGFRALPENERILLRYALADGLNVDAIGAIFSIHRATAARRVVKAHEHLVRAVKRALQHRLGAGHKDIASLVRVLGSQLHVSLERYLGPA